MVNASDIARLRENWQNEVDSAAEYDAMAANEADPRISQVYSSLAKMEETQIAFWEERLRLRLGGLSVGKRRPSWRSRVLGWIARRLGPETMLSTIAAKEAADRNAYASQPETQGTLMSAQERWHALVLSQLMRTQPHGLSGNFLGRLEGRHRGVGGNELRAAVLGANDGLCSNVSLVMGVAGASINHHWILMTGIAGLLAGACSMALGEWVSVTSSRELAEREIRIESSELAEDLKARARNCSSSTKRKDFRARRRNAWWVRFSKTRRPCSTRCCARNLVSIRQSWAGQPARPLSHRFCSSR